MMKIILSTISATLVVATFVVSIFLNSILGLFGLALTSVASLKNLQDSKQIVQKMKKRHKAKKLTVSKKFIKRSSKKIASSAVTAATIGTAGIVVTVAGFEVYDYCKDKEELLEDENILFETDKEFDFNKCLSDASKDSKEIVASLKETVPEAVHKAWKDTRGFSNETWESTKRISSELWGSTSDAMGNVWKSFTDWTN